MRSPRSIQWAIEHAMSDMTSLEQLVPRLITRTAKKRGLALSKLEIERLSEAILQAEGDSISVDLDVPCGFGKTEAKAKDELQAFFAALVASLPDFKTELTDTVYRAVHETINEVAAKVGERLEENAFEHALELRRAHDQRAMMTQRLWGETIKQLDLLRELVAEWGGIASEVRQGAYAQSTTAFALNRLFSRAYEIVGEILVLIRSGYADGALARWRSLHEVCVIAMFLSKRTDKCAEMYLEHHCIEELRMLQLDRTSGTAKRTNRHQDRYLRGLLARKSVLVNKYGGAFANDNGWAAVDLSRARVTFKDLETHVGLDLLRNGYQRANSTVHGGALATLTRVSLNTAVVDDSLIPPAYGCQTAARYSAASLSMLVAELCLNTENADLVTMGMVISNHACLVYGEIRVTEAEIAGDTPRARMLERRANRRRSRIKPQSHFRR